jgi:hypothetical protein
MPAFGERLGALAAELWIRRRRGGVCERRCSAQQRCAINRAPQISRQGEWVMRFGLSHEFPPNRRYIGRLPLDVDVL